jgi:hypothetical protein
VQYLVVSHVFSHVYLALGKVEEAKQLFLAAVELHQTSGNPTPRKRDELTLISGLTLCYQRQGELVEAEQRLQSALTLAEVLCGHMSDEALLINPCLKVVQEKIAAEVENRKRVLVVSTGSKLSISRDASPAAPQMGIPERPNGQCSSGMGSQGSLATGESHLLPLASLLPLGRMPHLPIHGRWTTADRPSRVPAALIPRHPSDVMLYLLRHRLRVTPKCRNNDRLHASPTIW